MSLDKSGMDKAKKKGITWGEAAKMVLENASKPMNHKEILRAILDQNLKEVTLKFSQALACLNAMLHANSRTPSSLFAKVSAKTNGKGTCYQLNKKQSDPVDSSDSDTDSQDSSSNDADTKDEEETTSSHFTSGIPSITNTSTGSLPPISSMLGSYQNNAITSTSVSSSIECAIADSRLSSLIAPTPDTLPIRSALSKKRGIKPCFRNGASSAKKPRVTFKLDDDKKDTSSRKERPAVKTKAELKYMGDDSNGAVSQNFIPPVLRPPMYPTHTVVKNSSSGYFGHKRYKKMSVAAQMKRSKEGQVDLVSPDSILSKINGRILINFRTFHLLPKLYQYQLVKLLPEVDQEIGSKGELKPTSTAFSNEFFTSAFDSWKDRLSEGEFTPEMNQKIQQEQEKMFNKDPWKMKHFESVWGDKLLENKKYVSPVEKSHQIMTDVRDEWEREQERIAKEKEEREKMAEEQERERKESTENTDLSAPNKINKNGDSKNVTAKQKAALVRQQKLAKAKTVSTKALKERKSAKNGNKSSTKDTMEENGKGKNRARTRYSKGKGGTNMDKKESPDTTVDIVGVKDEEDTKPDMQKVTPIQWEESETPEPTLDAGQRPIVKEKPSKKSSTKKKESASKSINSSLGFACMCVLKPMVICRRCGAFCHSDCINHMSLCTACVS